ncbi:MAG TPA: hypothetical protein VFR97_09270 [Capillimicrobium sp.]|nr:hypothetical protein [Capillimicrobium sp.]
MNPRPHDEAPGREQEPAPPSTPHAEPFARFSRLLRRGPLVAAGALPPGDDDESTAEFDVFDQREIDRFPTAVWGGYERTAVDERVATLEQELADLRAQLDPEVAVEAEIQQLSDETAEILRVAHGKADAMVKKAQADADALVADAEERAAAIVAEAEAKLKRLDHDTDLVWAERMRLTEDTRRLAQQLIQVADSAVERFPPESGGPEQG